MCLAFCSMGGGSRKFVLAPIARQTQPGKVEAAIEQVVREFRPGDLALELSADGSNERSESRGLVARGAKKFADLRGPAMQALAKLVEMRRRVVGKGEVGEEKARGAARGNSSKARIPEIEVHIRRRSGGKDEVVALDANAGRVADESDSFCGIEIANVMPGVAGGVEDIELARPDGEGLASFEDTEIFPRNREEFAVQAAHLVAVEAAGAFEKLHGISHVRRAERMHVHGEARILADERARGSGVVEMDVGEKDGVEVGDGKTARKELLAKRRKRTRGPRVDQRGLAVAFDETGGNRPWMAEPVDVERSGRSRSHVSKCNATARNCALRNGEGNGIGARRPAAGRDNYLGSARDGGESCGNAATC